MRAAIVRNLLRPIDFFLLIGVFLIRFSPWHQRLGDRVAHTIVVGTEYLAGPLYERRTQQRKLIALGILVALLLGGIMAFNYYGRPPLVVQSMQNTQDGPFEACVTGYMLGTPTRNGDTITYPVMYQMYGGRVPSQTGSITLQWHGFLGGWQWTQAQGTNCPSTP